MNHNIIESVYQLREQIFNTPEIRRETNSWIRKIFHGSRNKKIQSIYKAKRARELQKIEQLLTDLEENLFAIDEKAHGVAQSLSEKLKTQFPEHNIQLVLLGSNVSGGAIIEKELTIDSLHNPDFDCAVLVKGILDPTDSKTDAEFQKQKLFLGTIEATVKIYVKSKGYKLCTITNPSFRYAPIIESVDDALIMLKRYFGAFSDSRGLLYFFPTYPMTIWNQNNILIQEALKKLRNNPIFFENVISNICNEFRKNINFKDNHFSGKAVEDKTYQQYYLAQYLSRQVSIIVQNSRENKILQQPVYIVR
jgi:hypothetical protein